MAVLRHLRALIRRTAFLWPLLGVLLSGWR